MTQHTIRDALMRVYERTTEADTAVNVATVLCLLLENLEILGTTRSLT